MDEAEYWKSLRFRINSISSDAPSRRLALRGWCDWFEPKKYVLDGPSPRITGRVGFVSGRDAWEQPFILLLGRPFGSSSEVEWEKFLPPKDSDGWLRSEDNGRVILIDPCDSKASIGEPGATADGPQTSS